MRRAFETARRYAASLTGRIALLLAIGTSFGATVAILVAERARHAEFRRVLEERVVASAVDVVTRVQRDPARAEDQLRVGLLGAQLVRARAVGIQPVDSAMTDRINRRVEGALSPTIAHVSPRICLFGLGLWRRPRAAGFVTQSPPDCWLLTLSPGRNETQMRIAIDLPGLPDPPSTTADPLFLVLVGGLCLLLALAAASLATAPLRRLSAAAEAFARSIDAEPVPETGPADVRAALATFNLMQERVREGLRERTRMLAAISHDLQTPLTRLRLRLEQVSDVELRLKLVADLSATLAMVRRGLDLARSGESAEAWIVVDLDSLLGSIADDAAEFGHPVRVTGLCGARVRVRPDALARCIGNLLDNALKYGGTAELSCHQHGDRIVVTVRDHGAGMEAALLARAFEPFVRGDTSRSSGDGTGIGLAIARAQAAAIGGTLTLANHPDGGVAAEVVLPAK